MYAAPCGLRFYSLYPLVPQNARGSSFSISQKNADVSNESKWRARPFRRHKGAVFLQVFPQCSRNGTLSSICFPPKSAIYKAALPSMGLPQTCKKCIFIIPRRKTICNQSAYWSIPRKRPWTPFAGAVPVFWRKKHKIQAQRVRILTVWKR